MHPLEAFEHSSAVLTAFEMLCRIIGARAARSKPRVAFVGYDLFLLEHIEAMQDFVDCVVPDGGSANWRLRWNLFEGPSNCPERPSLPLDQLEPENFDAIFVVAPDLFAEERLFSKTRDRFPGAWVVSLGFVFRSFLRGLARINTTTHYSCLNSRKSAAAIMAMLLCPRRGCILECGTFRGGTSILMGHVLESSGDPRQVCAFDTFEGLPPPQDIDGNTPFVAGMFTETSREAVAGALAANGLLGRVSLHEGMFQDTLSRVLASKTEVSFALVDCDQFGGTSLALGEIIPHLLEGGLVLVDDYCERGVGIAVESQRKRHGLKCSGISFGLAMLFGI
jgi:hypothetical protein